MHRLFPLLLPFLAFVPISAEEIRSNGIAGKWEEAFPAGNASTGLMAFTGTDSDRMVLFSAKATPSTKEAAVLPPDSPAGKILEASKRASHEELYSWLPAAEPKSPLATVFLDWLNSDILPAKDFSRMVKTEEGVITTKFKRDGAGITGMVFCSAADDLMVIHLRADKPGALSFRLRMEHPTPRAKPRVEDRRVLILHGKESEAADSPEFEVRAWVYPMESEVTPTEKDIAVMGEGEALILIATATGAPGSPALSGIANRMKAFGFGGEEHPDVSLIWDGLLKRHLEAHRKLMKAEP